MANVNKYFAILEELIFENIEDKNPQSASNNLARVQANLKTIQKYVKLSLEELQNDESLRDILNPTTIAKPSESWSYVSYLFFIISNIRRYVNFDSHAKEDLISIRHTNDFLKSLQDCSCFGVRMYLLKAIKEHPIFKSHDSSPQTEDSLLNMECLKASLKFFREIFKIQVVYSSSLMETVVLDLMTGIYTLLFKGSDTKIYSEFLGELWQKTPKEKFFKNLLILKGIPQFPLQIQQKLHKDLLEKVTDPGGFRIFVESLSSGKREEIPSWRQFEIIAKIVAHPGHSPLFFEVMIPQIFDFIRYSLQHGDDLEGAGVIVLRRLCGLNQILKDKIRLKLNREYFEALMNPPEILTGAVVMEDLDFRIFVNFIFTCFCTSSLQGLQSEFLIEYLPLLINLYSQLPEGSTEQERIKAAIIHCLSNRSKEELNKIIKDLIFESSEFCQYRYLHPRIVVHFNQKFQSYSVQIVPKEMQHTVESSEILCKILKSSKNNILIYNVFISVLELLDTAELNPTNEFDKIDLLQNEDEVEEFICNKFKSRMNVISLLTDLIAFKSFHFQFHENPREIFELIQKFLQSRLDRNVIDAEVDQNLSIVLAIFQELMEQSKDTAPYKDLLYILRQYLKLAKNSSMKFQIESCVDLIERGGASFRCGAEKSDFAVAKSLLNQSEPHLRVYGIQQLCKLLNAKDEETVANKHAILAITLQALRDKESYAYLNCVRLLVVLVAVLEAEVFETLQTEYLNEEETVDYRLKIGEAVLKVTEDLGPLSYKYKNVLLNCFLFGSRSKTDEFRASSLSNLAALCKLLSYQIHSFFNEFVLIFESILQTDKYLPARRAAVMVMSQLLWGIENLFDFEEYLLQIYRLLNGVLDNEKDEVARVHATNGLEILKKKCKSLLFPPEPKLEKEIKIFGINDLDNRNKAKKGHILELN